MWHTHSINVHHYDARIDIRILEIRQGSNTDLTTMPSDLPAESVLTGLAVPNSGNAKVLVPGGKSAPEHREYSTGLKTIAATGDFGPSCL